VSSGADKQDQILRAAVRVFASRGSEATRVSDIATEAGVAYGLVYHYFASKEAVLEAVIRDAWGRLVSALSEAEQAELSSPEKLELVVKIVLRTWRDDPDLVRLLVREINRSPEMEEELAEIGEAFATLERIVAAGQREGTIRSIDPRLAAWMLYGALDELLTGWVLDRLPDDAAAMEAAEREVSATLVGGLIVEKGHLDTNTRS
jgi:TetR/AcrR family transcriptional regulator, fatty acid metabolism regulator protein